MVHHEARGGLFHTQRKFRSLPYVLVGGGQVLQIAVLGLWSKWSLAVVGPSGHLGLLEGIIVELNWFLRLKCVRRQSDTLGRRVAIPMVVL